MFTTNFSYGTMRNLDNDKVFAEFRAEIKRITGKDCIGIDRENFMFGYSPRLCFADNTQLYYMANKLFTWDELKTYLFENWRPVKQDEQDYFCNHIA